ncbi:MAG: 50S ribosomal protein L5 [Deltaproteobacteria bacterium]|nr:50S ribosomal protein L5 [Deltaproteobacteria bacterium]
MQDKYKKEVIPALMKRLDIKNPMLVPQFKKIVVNSSTGEALQNPKTLDAIAQDLATITGQKPVIRKAKKSIAGFKLREGQPIGVSVTLRRKSMYEFYNRMVNIAFPRSRDFRGFSRKGFDGRGNYSLGITEQIIFPEILPEKVEKIRGMNVTIVTSAQTNEDALALLEEMGFPFRK